MEPPLFAHYGGQRGPAKIVFLHGMCGHGMGYAQSFQHAAAKYGTLIAPQGDTLCGQGPWAKWSRDLESLDRRIVEGYRALGMTEPVQDVMVIGYSMGATRALELAQKFPERYTRVILMGAPSAPAPGSAKALRGAVMMAGERDRQDQMKAGVRSFQHAGIPSTFILIPEARHGAMGPTPERTMSEALEWLDDHQRPLEPDLTIKPDQKTAEQKLDPAQGKARRTAEPKSTPASGSRAVDASTAQVGNGG